ncbi:hypothetical protein [Halobacillus litoralis]|uniref:hypothetical protein n=1 Tax=Halobacillus litoralis TaxID=45668 RepID=UPI001CFD15A7|nr:hypothetical protein [Halobacillus litoralis]
MIYAYISPLLIVVFIFTATVFVVDWLAKLLIYVFILNLLFLPGFLLFKEELKEKQAEQSSIQEGKQNAQKDADSQ